MSVGQIVVVTPDAAFGAHVASAVAPVGADVVSVRVLDEAPAVAPLLWILHRSDDQTRLLPHELARLGASPVLVVVSRATLPLVVELMGLVPQVAGIVSSEALDATRLRAIVGRAIGRDGFGLASLLGPEASIRELRIGDHDDKVRCMGEVAGSLEARRAPLALIASVEQCLDEMLMNALYDAPVDKRGRHVFGGVPTAKRVAQRTDHEVVLTFGTAGDRFAVAVRDAFGSLKRDIVVSHLHKGLHADDKVDRKAGGAGLGLYLMTNASTSVMFTVSAGAATEVACLFSLGKPEPLAELGFFLREDAQARAQATPARVRASAAVARRRRTRALVTVAAVGTLATAGVLAWPRLFPPPPSSVVTIESSPPGATIEIDGRVAGTAAGGGLIVRTLKVGQRYTVAARLADHAFARTQITPADGASEVKLELPALAVVELDTLPAGALVTLDGKPAGTTPLRLSTLKPGTKAAFTLSKPGYRTTAVALDVPARGAHTARMQSLERDDGLVAIRLISTPPGAEVLRDGQPNGADRTYTPTEVFVEAGKQQRFTLTMPGHRPLVIEPFVVEKGQESVEKGGALTTE